MKKALSASAAPDIGVEIIRHLEVFNRFYELSLRQKHLLETGDFDELFAMNNQKRRLVDIIKDQREEVIHLKELLEHINDDGLQSRQILELFANLIDVVHCILESENRNIHSIEKSRSFFQNECFTVQSEQELYSTVVNTPGRI